jgi:hypothetical protein
VRRGRKATGLIKDSRAAEGIIFGRSVFLYTKETSMSREARKLDRPDRREKRTPLISKYTFWGGQRKKARRKTDKRRHLFVDCYSLHLLSILLILLLFNYIDSYLTLALIQQKVAVEGNPIMAFHMEHGILPFVANKGFITSISLAILCIFKNFYIAKIGLAFSVLIYFFIVLYELFLLLCC